MEKVVYSRESDLRLWRFGLEMYRWRERKIFPVHLCLRQR